MSYIATSGRPLAMLLATHSFAQELPLLRRFHLNRDDEPI